MAPHHFGTGSAEGFSRRLHDFAQGFGLRFGRHAGQDNAGQRRLRFGPHRPDIAHRVNGGDPRHAVVIADKGAQMVGGQHLLAIATGQHSGIIAGAGQHILAHSCRQGLQHGLQIGRGHLGAAAATQGHIAHFLAHAFCHVTRQGRGGHFWVFLELAHEFQINVVLPFPQQRPVQPQTRLVCNRTFAAGQD